MGKIPVRENSKTKAIGNKASTKLTFLISVSLLQIKLTMKSRNFGYKLSNDKDRDFKALDNYHFPKPHVYATQGKI